MVIGIYWNTLHTFVLSYLNSSPFDVELIYILTISISVLLKQSDQLVFQLSVILIFCVSKMVIYTYAFSISRLRSGTAFRWRSGNGCCLVDFHHCVSTELHRKFNQLPSL